jgi:hypothetical protein
LPVWPSKLTKMAALRGIVSSAQVIVRHIETMPPTNVRLTRIKRKITCSQFQRQRGN